MPLSAPSPLNSAITFARNGEKVSFDLRSQAICERKQDSTEQKAAFNSPLTAPVIITSSTFTPNPLAEPGMLSHDQNVCDKSVVSIGQGSMDQSGIPTLRNHHAQVSTFPIGKTVPNNTARFSTLESKIHRSEVKNMPNLKGHQQLISPNMQVIDFHSGQRQVRLSGNTSTIPQNSQVHNPLGSDTPLKSGNTFVNNKSMYVPNPIKSSGDVFSRDNRTTQNSCQPNHFVASPTETTNLLSTSSDIQSLPSQESLNKFNNDQISGADNSCGRRQKRLERNRESARLSRRRRKQYLEVLEERVSALSDTMDKGRFSHVAQCVSTIQRLRRDRISLMDQDLQKLGLNSTQTVRSSLQKHEHTLNTTLSRTGNELRVAMAFQKMQMKSIVLPPQSRFILWLTLQNDPYFLGGRAASERLSAARIGERMLNGGTDRSPPAHGMWPLFCSEVNLSYDQEERVRHFQRTTLANPKTWLDYRHSTVSVNGAIESLYDVSINLSEMVQQREKESLLNVLSIDQRAKLRVWIQRQKELRQDKVDSILKSIRKSKYLEQPHDQTKNSSSYHNATNVYILMKKLHTVIKNSKLPSAPNPLPRKESLKRLSRRSSFESLSGASSSTNDVKGLDGMTSHSSTGSLKRSSSVLSNDNDSEGDVALNSYDTSATQGKYTMSSYGQNTPTLTPEEAQVLSQSLVSEALKPAGIELPELQRAHHIQTPHQQDTDMLPDIVPSNTDPNIAEAKIVTPESYSLNMGGVNSTDFKNENWRPNNQSQPATSFIPNNFMPTFSTPMQENTGGHVTSVDQGNMIFYNQPIPPQPPNTFLIPSLLPTSNVAMNIVPEESEQAMEDYFLDLGPDDDWAIGGFDVGQER